MDGTDLPRISDTKGYEALAPGTEYVDPEGKTRKKAWQVTDPSSYEKVPEGETYTDPTGTSRTKPTYGSLDFSTETLFGMALTDNEKVNALERAYGKGSAKKDASGEYYVEKDGQRLKAGRRGYWATTSPITGEAVPLMPGQNPKDVPDAMFIKSPVSAVVGGAAPTIGAAAGGLAGGALGTAAEPGGGTAIGAVAGSAGGAAAGQAFNDMMLGLFGIYDRTPGEEAENLGIAAAAGGAGEVAGRVVLGAVPSIRAGVSNLQKAAPYAVAKYLGATQTPEAAATAAELAAKGVRVPPSSWMPEAPYLKFAVEVADPKFRSQNVLQESAREYYEAEGNQLLDALGIPKEGREPLTSATAPVSSEKAGVSVLKRVKDELATSDAALARAMDESKAAAISKFPVPETRAAHLQTLMQTVEENRGVVKRTINEGFESIDRDIEAAAKEAGTDKNPGDLMRSVAEKIKTLKAAVSKRASTLYRAADTAAGGDLPDVEALAADAKLFLKSLPEPFRAKYPDIVGGLARISGDVTDAEAAGAAEVKEIEPVTFGQLRNLRSILRNGVDYNDLTPNIRDGVYKYFASKLDRLIHSPQGTPKLREAAALLDKADSFYASEMPRFRDKTVQALVTGLKSGMPADPKAVADMVFTGIHTERMNEVRRIVGPVLWKAIQAADTQSAIEASRTLIPGEIDGMAFAKQMLERVRTGVLEKGYDKEFSEKVLKQAQRIMMSEGKIPLTERPGDTITDMLRRADEALKQAEALAKQDPIANLTKEIKGIEQDFAKQSEDLRRALGPLRFLANPTALAMKSADRILSNPDLLTAAATKFGRDSPEFTMLRQVAAQRLFQRSIGEVPGLAKEFAEKVTPEEQAVLFPGVTLDTAKKLAKNMKFLLAGSPEGTGASGASIAAQSRVLHPLSSVPLVGGLLKYVGALPGVDAAGRAILTKYYQFMSWGTTHPAFVRWVASAVEKGPEGRDVAAQAFATWMKLYGGAAGAGTGEALYQRGR